MPRAGGFVDLCRRPRHLPRLFPRPLSAPGFRFRGNQGTFTGSTTITCGGSVCATIKAPVGVPTVFGGTGTGPIPNLTLGSIHGDFPSFGFAFELGSISALTIDFTLGRQVTAMQPVPEPSSVLLLASGLAGLVLKRQFRVLH
ncbi:MAG TPA: PEP-CTERM sorting domain-containing protein [Myxococcota bacterium]|nr:PEP-CTERM sorting domain-containing protein [Myxococcota bacterium]